MKSLNKIQLIGFVGSKEETKRHGDMTIAKFSLATSEKVKDKDVTQWHRLVCFGSLADIVEKYIDKGSKLYVEGKMTYGKYQSKEGHEVKTSDIIVSNIIMLDSKGDKKDPLYSGNDASKNVSSEKFENVFDDDIPF